MNAARSRRAAARAVVLAAGLAACGGEAGPDAGAAAGLAVSVDTVDGVERLLYPERPGPALPWRLESEAVIGGFGADDPRYQFGGVTADMLAGGPGGTLYVADGDGKRILRYGSDGSWRGEWGRAGAGPGELGDPAALAPDPVGDTLWVADIGNLRFQLYAPDAGAGRTVPMPEGGGFAGGLTVTTEGPLVVLQTFSFDPSDPSFPPRPLLALDRAGAVRDTVWTAPPPPVDVFTATGPGGSRSMGIVRRTFSPRLRWAAWGDGSLVLSQDAAYVLRWVDPAGREVRRVERGPEPRPVTEADREAARERIRAEAAEADDPRLRGMIESRIDHLTFAETVPRITGLRIDGRGRVWVGVAGEAPDETVRIDVYDGDGRLVGEIRDAPLLPDLLWGDGRAAVLEEDEVEVQRIPLLRLVEGGAAS